MVELALEIATKAHKGQFDKAGVDYIKHPITVASMCVTDSEKIVALLHDVLEDTDVSTLDLENYGFDNAILEAIQLLTKSDETTYSDYIMKIKSNELARVVKINDLKHNSDLSRLNEITNEDVERVKKYKQSINYLRNQ